MQVFRPGGDVEEMKAEGASDDNIEAEAFEHVVAHGDVKGVLLNCHNGPMHPLRRLFERHG